MIELSNIRFQTILPNLYWYQIYIRISSFFHLKGATDGIYTPLHVEFPFVTQVRIKSISKCSCNCIKIYLTKPFEFVHFLLTSTILYGFHTYRIKPWMCYASHQLLMPMATNVLSNFSNNIFQQAWEIALFKCVGEGSI